MDMGFFYVILLAVAVSIDGLVAGVAYGLKNIRMPLVSLAIVGIVTAILTGFAMFCAYILGQFIDTDLAIITGALLLILLGLWSLCQQYLTRNVPSYEMDGEVTARKLTFSIGRLVISIVAKPETADFDHLGYINTLEACFLGLALGLDAMVGTFAAALMGVLPQYTPAAVGVIHMICIAVGCYASTKFVPDTLKKRFPYLPGILLIFLGLIRMA